MKVDIFITESLRTGHGCNLDIVIAGIPVVGEIRKRINETPYTITQAMESARDIREHLDGICQVRIYSVENLMKQRENIEKAKAAVTTNNNRPREKSK